MILCRSEYRPPLSISPHPHVFGESWCRWIVMSANRDVGEWCCPRQINKQEAGIAKREQKKILFVIMDKIIFDPRKGFLPDSSIKLCTNKPTRFIQENIRLLANICKNMYYYLKGAHLKFSYFYKWKRTLGFPKISCWKQTY